VPLALLEAARQAGRPLKGRALASPAGCRYNPHCKSVLVRLVRQGRLMKTMDGYTVEK
jgi:hypothetical protein